MMEFMQKQAGTVIVANKNIQPWKTYKGRSNLSEGPRDFNIQRTTVWSFPERGSWATHTPQYRGNWPPEVVRNILELYSSPGDTVLDPMVGGGTTPVECILTGRNCIAVDINPDAIAITRDRLDIPESVLSSLPMRGNCRTFVGDTRRLDMVGDSTVDLITAHPPYANMIKYTDGVEGDLSRIDDYVQFFNEFRKAISEYYRVLKPNGYCAVLIGDTHNKGHFVPLTTRMMYDFLREGFVLKEDIIKKEWNCESDRYVQKYSNSNFLLTMHEHLFIFRKARSNEYLPNSSLDLFMYRSESAFLAELVYHVAFHSLHEVYRMVDVFFFNEEGVGSKPFDPLS
jgi:DNA modification methylase